MIPRNEKYIWTEHAHMKMRHYRLTESRIKRVIRHPSRIEEGILEGAIACMSPQQGKNYTEIWAMYKIEKSEVKDQESKMGKGFIKNAAYQKLIESRSGPFGDGGKIKIITAWRYPGKSPERDPVPEDILREVWKLL